MADISLLPVVGKLDGLTAVQKINEALTSLNEANRLGIPAWSSTTSYGAGALTWDAGQTYKSTVANSGQRPSTTPASWVSWGLTLSDLQNGYETMAEATGTAGVYAATYWPAITGLANGQELRFKVPIDNTGASTLAVNAIPAAPILSLSGATLQRGELVANGVARVRWSATRNAFILLNCEGAASSSGSGLPLLFPLWCPNRAAIPTGYAPADGQTLSRSLYPDAWAGIAAGNVPVATDAAWLATPTERGKFTAGDGAGTFRLPDYNGKSAGSLGALFLRGDGTLSAQTDGVIQPDDFRSHFHTYGNYSSTAATLAVGPTSNPGTFASSSSGSTGGAETRPMNVTGCWVIRLFGAVVNPG
ncbi:phage tail protein, partial [Microvirgula aerodenitrificans]|uniref:phage tail protein n=1 Tax=Microvirgula aerodenitrificans TaxID=57480 RepID=UPI00248ED4EB